MPKKLPRFYQVRCYEATATEMARYEGATIISRTDPECRDIWIGSDFEEDYTTWLYTIQANPLYLKAGSPNRARWASFGVVDIKDL